MTVGKGIVLAGLLATLVACATVPVTVAGPGLRLTPLVGVGAADPDAGLVAQSLALVLAVEGEEVPALVLEGNLPTPCHRPSAGIEVDPKARAVRVALAAERRIEGPCIQQLVPYSWILPLAGVVRGDEPWTLRVGAHVQTLAPRGAPQVALTVARAVRVEATTPPHLLLATTLPTPCHVPHLAMERDEAARVLRLELQALVPDGPCVQQLTPVVLRLPLAELAKGWRIDVNGRPVG